MCTFMAIIGPSMMKDILKINFPLTKILAIDSIGCWLYKTFVGWHSKENLQRPKHSLALPAYNRRSSR